MKLKLPWLRASTLPWLFGLQLGCGGEVATDSGGETGGGAGSSSGGGGCAPLPCDASGDIQVLADNQAYPFALAADLDAVYWPNATVEDYDPTAEGTIMRVGKQGGPLTKLADVATQPVAVALEKEFVYWTTTGGEIGRVPKDGGESEILFDGGKELFFVSVDAEHVFAASWPQHKLIRVAIAQPHQAQEVKGADVPYLLATGPNATFWTGDHGVMKLPKGASSAVPVYETDNHKGALQFVGIAVDDTRVYFSSWLYYTSDCNTGHILSVRHDGTDLFTVASNVETAGSRMAVDDAFVYWTEGNAGRVMKAPKGGGEAVPIACNQATPLGIAVDDAFVYWANDDGGTIMRASK